MTRRITCLAAGLTAILAASTSASAANGLGSVAEMGFGTWSLDEDNAGRLEITWDWSKGQLAGFQFNMTGVVITDVFGGLAEDHSFSIFHDDDSAIAFFSQSNNYIEPTEGPEILIMVDFIWVGDGETIRLEEVVCSDPAAESIPVEHGEEIDPEDVACCGDINSDGIVDGSDLTLLLGVWGACDMCAADFNNDGTVDGADLTVLLGCWGICP